MRSLYQYALVLIAAGLLMVPSAAFGISEARQKRVFYSEVQQDSFTLTSAGDTNEISYSNTANRIFVSVEAEGDSPADNAVHVSIGTADATDTDFTYYDKVDNGAGTNNDAQFSATGQPLAMFPVSVDTLNFKLDADATGDAVEVHVWAFRL